MSMRWLLIIPALLVVAVVLTACSTTTSPIVPAQLLSCAPQPPSPAGGTQREVGLYVIDLAAAGDDCRSKLGAVRGLLTGESP